MGNYAEIQALNGMIVHLNVSLPLTNCTTKKTDCFPISINQSINQSSKYPTHLPVSQSDEGNSSVEVPSSQICLSLCQVNKNEQVQILFLYLALSHILKTFYYWAIPQPLNYNVFGFVSFFSTQGSSL